MKTCCRFAMICLLISFLFPCSSLAATPSAYQKNQLKSAMDAFDGKMKAAQDTYDRYKEKGKLWEESNGTFKAVELLQAMEELLTWPQTYYQGAVKAGWPETDPVLTAAREKLKPYLEGKLDDLGVIVLGRLGEAEIPELGDLANCCVMSRLAWFTVQQQGPAGVDAARQTLASRDKRLKRLMDASERAELEGSSRGRGATPKLKDHEAYKRAKVIMDKYEGLCEKVFAQTKELRTAAVQDMERIAAIHKELREVLLEKVEFGHIQATKELADAIEAFESSAYPKHKAYIETFGAKYAPKTSKKIDGDRSLDVNNEVNGSFQAILGNDYREEANKYGDPGNKYSGIVLPILKIDPARKEAAKALADEVTRSLSGVKDFSEERRSKVFQDAATPLALALRFDPENAAAKKLMDSFQVEFAKLTADLEAKIDARVWNPAHAEDAPPNAVELAEAAWKVLMKDPTWTQKDRHLIALRIAGPWRTIEYNILKQPTRHGVPIDMVAQFDSQKGKDLCFLYKTIMLTEFGVGVKKALPFSHHGGCDRYQMRVSKVKPGIAGSTVADEYVAKVVSELGLKTAGPVGGSSSGAASSLYRIVLSGACMLAGLLAAAPLISKKVPQLAAVYEGITPLRNVLGVCVLAIGILGFLGSLLSLAPLANILPQSLAVLSGLFLGKEILLKKPAPKAAEKEAVKTEAAPAEGAAAEEAPSGGAAEAAAGAAEAAGEAAEAAATAAQDLLIKHREKIDQLEKFQIPIGIACLVFGLLHLLLGGYGLL